MKCNVQWNGLGKFRGIMLAVGFESGEAKVVASLVGGGGGLVRPVIFPSEVMGKGSSVSNQTNMIEGGCRGEREAFTEDGSF